VEAGHYGDEDTITTIVGLNGLATVVVGRFERRRIDDLSSLRDPFPLQAAAIAKDTDTFRASSIEGLKGNLWSVVSPGPDFRIVHEPLLDYIHSQDVHQAAETLPADATLTDAWELQPQAVSLLDQASRISINDRYIACDITERDAQQNRGLTLEFYEMLHALYGQIMMGEVNQAEGHPDAGCTMLGLDMSHIKMTQYPQWSGEREYTEIDQQILHAVEPHAASESLPRLALRYCVALTRDAIETIFKINPRTLTTTKLSRPLIEPGVYKIDGELGAIDDPYALRDRASFIGGIEYVADRAKLTKTIELINDSRRVFTWIQAKKRDTKKNLELCVEAQQLLTILEKYPLAAGYVLGYGMVDEMRAWAWEA
jgi:hypothetical protein